MLLSICIPSYDRFDLLNKNLKSILESTRSKEFEIVVVDNCSPTDIMKEIVIQDPRVRIIKRKKSVSGPRNVNESLSFAAGKYALLCLDKDGIRGELLDDFLNALKCHPEICGGFCTILPTGNHKMEICKKNRVRKFGYIGKHPSGDFYKTDYVKEAYSKFTEEEMENPYVYDWLLAECAAKGPMLKYDYPIMVKSPPHKARERKSSSFSPKMKNVFLLPPNIISQFYLDCHHLEGLDISYKEKIETLSRLYRLVLQHITLDYRTVMMIKDVCFHYHMDTRHVSSKEMFYWWHFFASDFLQSSILSKGREVWIKYAISILMNVKFICGRWRKFL